MPDVISAALDLGGKLIDRLWPDPAQKAAAQLELLKLAQTGELAQLTADTDLARGQLAINQAEASSGNSWAAGWRPGVGWVCVVVLANHFVAAPYGEWIAGLMHNPVKFPDLPMGDLWTLLLGILGLGTMRSVEKIKGVAK